MVGKRFVGQRILLFLFQKSIEIGRELAMRGFPVILNFLSKLGQGANGTFVGTDQALSSWTTKNCKAQRDDCDHCDGCHQGRAGVSAHGLTPDATAPAVGPTRSALRSEPK